MAVLNVLIFAIGAVATVALVRLMQKDGGVPSWHRPGGRPVRAAPDQMTRIRTACTRLLPYSRRVHSGWSG